jgi:hypothetical protein
LTARLARVLTATPEPLSGIEGASVLERVRGRLPRPKRSIASVAVTRSCNKPALTASETERRYRADCAARGYTPDEDDWVIRDICSGEWEQRRKRSLETLDASRAPATRTPPQPREGVMFNVNGAPNRVVKALRRRAVFERAEPKAASAPQRESIAVVATPREHRPSASRRASPRGSPDDEPGPGRAGQHELRVIPLAVFRRELRRALGGAA